MRKTIIQLITIVLLAQSVFIGHVTAALSDIAENHPHKEAIEYVEKENLFQWKNAFKPAKQVKKGEFLKALIQQTGFQSQEKNTLTPYLQRAKTLDILDDTEEFKSNQPISRIEALHWALRREGYPLPKVLKKTDTGFKDVPEKAWYIPVILHNKELHLIDPLSENNFGPKRFLTREVAAELLYRLSIIASGELQETIDEISFFEMPINENGEQAAITELPKLDLLLTVWKKINDAYIDRSKLDREKLMYAAISGLVKSIEDPYTVFNGPVDTRTVQENLQGEIEGIGAFIMLRDGKITVISPIKNSPAEKAGIQAGDIIVEVDDQSVEGLSLEEVAGRIRGKIGTEVKLRIRRDASVFLVIITRDKVTVEPVQGEIKAEGKIAYFNISSFSQRMVPAFERIAIDFFNNRRPQPQGVILDLRNNPGGFLESAIQFLGHFVPQGTPVVQIKFPDSILEHQSPGPSDLHGIPLVILQNKGSASASEIVAGTLQGLGLAKIVGETSFGKGTVQELNIYDDGSSLKLTIAKWRTGKGEEIDEKGVTPDIIVTPAQTDQSTGRDAQLERAIEELVKMITIP